MIDPAGNPFPWLLSPVLLIQGSWVRARTQRLPEADGPREGRCGTGPLLRMTALGDSIIAGVGVPSTAQALPARLAEALAARLGRDVWWDSKGRNGARTRDPEIQTRKEHELKIIHDMGFDTYFLIVWDLCEFARRRDI